MQLAQVVFAIDNGADLRTRKKFLKWVDNLVATEQISYCSPCIGMWEGQLETSYLMREVDFHSCIRGSVWVKDQICVLVVSGDTRQDACLYFLSSGVTESLGGPPVEVTFGDALSRSGWTYVEATGKYFAVRQGEY